MDKKIFIPEKYGMETCPRCNSHGYIQNLKRHPCPNCGGFGSTKKETEQNTLARISIRILDCLKSPNHPKSK